jgi:hypothetical protein
MSEASRPKGAAHLHALATKSTGSYTNHGHDHRHTSLPAGCEGCVGYPRHPLQLLQGDAAVATGGGLDIRTSPSSFDTCLHVGKVGALALTL